VTITGIQYSKTPHEQVYEFITLLECWLAYDRLSLLDLEYKDMIKSLKNRKMLYFAHIMREKDNIIALRRKIIKGITTPKQQSENKLVEQHQFLNDAENCRRHTTM